MTVPEPGIRCKALLLPPINDEVTGIPQEYELYQNYPNPFNASTVIKYALPKSSTVSLVIYNLMGQKIMRWDENNVTPGYYEKIWNGKTDAGIPVSSGIYVYRINAGDFVETRKMVLLK
ncbi:T9SS type A sorting domain-containing protein [Candidatus Marinimicrobia bacterium MT.SAG.3]|nr:T9SS type A sorting domain-containing protein [Candidatus Marinimicrobia bacterium MT.SAG.3]